MIRTDPISSVINEDLINQIPGFFLVMDINSKFIATNKMTLKLIGFKSHDAMISKTYCNMPCKVANQHEIFMQQDKIVLARNNPLRILGYFCYANDNWRVLFGEKYLLKNKYGEIIGLISQFSDITNLNLIDLSKFLDIDNNGHAIKIRKQQISYILEDHYQDFSLPDRQSECLFFLLRRKTAKEIAKILKLSPRTVESYIEQIKFKLNCSTKSELIDKAINNGYMNIIPKHLLETLK